MADILLSSGGIERIGAKTRLEVVREGLWIHVQQLPERKPVISVTVGDDDNTEAIADLLSANGFRAEAIRMREIVIEARRGPPV